MTDPHASTQNLIVTVAVVVKDRRRLMARCLDAIADLDPAPDEVVLVDNGSTDGTLELMEGWAASAPIATTVVQEHGSLGRARNAAVAAAAGDVLAFTDSDCAPRPDWLARGVSAFTPEVAVVQGRTVPREPVTRPWPATQDIGAFTGLYEACNIFYRRAVLQEAGGFGEDIGFFGEDTVAGWRVRRAGWRSAFARGAVVAHEVTYPGLTWHLQRARDYAHFNALVRQFPEMRAELLWSRVFLRRRNVEFLAALAGLAGVTRGRPWAALLAVPYLRRRVPDHLDPTAVLASLQAAAFDAVVEAALVRGSLKERTLVL